MVEVKSAPETCLHVLSFLFGNYFLHPPFIRTNVRITRGKSIKSFSVRCGLKSSNKNHQSQFDNEFYLTLQLRFVDFSFMYAFRFTDMIVCYAICVPKEAISGILTKSYHKSSCSNAITNSRKHKQKPWHRNRQNKLSFYKNMACDYSIIDK